MGLAELGNRPAGDGWGPCDRAHIAFCSIALAIRRFLWSRGADANEARRQWVTEGTMQYLLILLVVVTMACGAAASVTISLAPAYADDSGKGY